MPELPDVEVFKRYLGATALHQKIAKVRSDALNEGNLTCLPSTIPPVQFAGQLQADRGALSRF